LAEGISKGDDVRREGIFDRDIVGVFRVFVVKPRVVHSGGNIGRDREEVVEEKWSVPDGDEKEN